MMNKSLVRIFIITFLMEIIMAGFFSVRANVPAEKTTVIQSGKDGALSWNLNSNGHLTITGTGDFDLSDGSEPAWCSQADAIKTATVQVTGITDTKHFFFGCKNLTTVDVSGLDTSNVTNMQNMFYGCKSLTSLDLSGFNTRKVTNMVGMFSSCVSLKEVDLSSFETPSLKVAECMFNYCKSLVSLDLSNFDLSNVRFTEAVFLGETSAMKKIALPATYQDIPLHGTFVDENGESVTVAKANPDGPTVFCTAEYLESYCNKNGHKYAAPVFVWKNHESATALFSCTIEGCDVENTKKVKTVITKILTPPTYETAGNERYIASVSFGGKTYTDIKNVAVPKLDPDIKGVGTSFQYDGAVYIVSKSGAVGATVQYASPIDKKAKKILVPDTVRVNGVTYEVTAIKSKAFEKNKKLKTITIGQNITVIGDKAFYKCTALTKVVIPDKVTKIGRKAFEGCKRLRLITIKSKMLKSVGKHSIKGIKKNAKIDVPNKKKKKYRKLFKSKTGFKKTMKLK